MPTTPLTDRVKVLVIDDEKEICLLLDTYLTGVGYEVRTATSGQEAVSIVSSFSPHFILLDIMMPGMNGIETLQKIRELDKVAVVIMATALHDLNIAREAITLGAADYITKPIDLEYLSDFITEKSRQYLQ